MYMCVHSMSNLPYICFPLCRRASRTNVTQDSSVFICISMLARAVGPQVEKDIKALLDQMFSVGLSVELTSALRIIAQEVPQLQRDIQGEILVRVHTWLW